MIDSQNLALHLDRFVRRLHIALSKRAASFDTEKVGPGGAMILLTMDELGEVPVNVLTERMARDKSQMTRALRNFEDKGLIVRRDSETDARVSLVQLTDKGQAVVKTHQAVVAEEINRLLGPIPNAERQTLYDVLHRAVGTPNDEGDAKS